MTSNLAKVKDLENRKHPGSPKFRGGEFKVRKSK
jgi:hypothetical protein